jgi:hypothetical protein
MERRKQLQTRRWKNPIPNRKQWLDAPFQTAHGDIGNSYTIYNIDDKLVY